MITECSKCRTYVCRVGDLAHMPDNCPMQADFPITEEIYNDPEDLRIARVAAQVIAQGHRKWTRVEDIMEFARRLGINKLGLAFCSGLRQEAKILTNILEANGFEVISAICKAGGVPKEAIGIPSSDKVHAEVFEPMCNPIAQAILLNRAKTGLNIVLGLCLGHDCLFIKYSEALVTVLAVKDRMLAHNPLGAIYMADGFYKQALYEDHKLRG